MHQHRIQQLERELFDVKNSLSFKIGWYITFPVRKIYNLLESIYPKLLENRKERIYYNRIVRKYQQNNPNVIFTYILNNYDYLKEPNIISEGWDYLCFTDNPEIKSNVWQVIILNEFDFFDFPKNHKKRASLIMIQYYKFISKRYKIVMSINGAIKINCNLNEIIKKTFNFKGFDIMIFKHPIRDCIYEEAEVCKELNKDSHFVIDEQMSRFMKQGFPKHAKLYSNGIIIRKNRSSRLKKVSLVWSKEFIEGSLRDQLSLNYAIWKTKSKIKIQEFERYKYLDRNENSPFIITDHQKKQINQ